MGRRGTPYDNAKVESFMNTVKCGEIYINAYETVDDVVGQLPRFIDQPCNAERLRSALGYLSPIEF